MLVRAAPSFAAQKKSKIIAPASCLVGFLIRPRFNVSELAVGNMVQPLYLITNPDCDGDAGVCIARLRRLFG